MLELKCDLCHRDLEEPGALVFSPPKDDGWTVAKYHVCAECWPAIRDMFGEATENDGVR